MEANFFKQIAKMDLQSKVTLTIAKATEDKIVVSILVQNDGCGDKAKYIIPPLNLKGTAEELDAEFFSHIKKPIESASGLMSNMEAFMKQMEEAKKQSAMEKEKADKAKKEKDVKIKKYNDAMAKAEALEKEGKFKEAWTALPKASEYPDHAETIGQKQNLYQSHFAGDLFASPQNQNEEPLAEVNV
ncbi:prtrc system protein e [Chryseobacterium lactis]|uniref:PRTRC system protein E n=3 Tax=Chryseobacterium TaxID=59732 RepID=A0A3G6RJ22_CHRLC|nr:MULTISPECIES: PRTRC system protein E [Bacteroidota]AZA84583.1 PRTRC system protein E [Chryseobacterium lactis]AZB04971.1 PRTRC system protein E [Chryseobacterium lactis]KMQ64446.1 prtrc system protein e [Chryseobacterium angstadtii]MBF6643610.1 PRTRC system protein E [Chryseobacterium indologenes]PNW14702.1 prtrc system protein e [Chryseobacterium lactis]